MLQDPNPIDDPKLEAEVNRLLKLRDKALKLNAGGQVMQAEAQLDKLCLDWRDLIADDSGSISPMALGALWLFGGAGGRCKVNDIRKEAKRRVAIRRQLRSLGAFGDLTSLDMRQLRDERRKLYAQRAEFVPLLFIPGRRLPR